MRCQCKVAYVFGLQNCDEEFHSQHVLDQTHNINDVTQNGVDKILFLKAHL